MTYCYIRTRLHSHVHTLCMRAHANTQTRVSWPKTRLGYCRLRINSCRVAQRTTRRNATSWRPKSAVCGPSWKENDPSRCTHACVLTQLSCVVLEWYRALWLNPSLYMTRWSSDKSWHNNYSCSIFVCEFVHTFNYAGPVIERITWGIILGNFRSLIIRT